MRRRSFDSDEMDALRALRANPTPVRGRRVGRMIVDAQLVQMNAVSRAVPHACLAKVVEVVTGVDRARVFRGAGLIAEHRRSDEPDPHVVEPSPCEGLVPR